jgi:hypothetical protein
LDGEGDGSVVRKLERRLVSKIFVGRKIRLTKRRPQRPGNTNVSNPTISNDYKNRSPGSALTPHPGRRVSGFDGPQDCADHEHQCFNPE